MTPLLSICIPTYNRHLWLRSSLYNWLPQVAQFRECVELIVSDNASSDETERIIEEAKGWGSFRYHRNKTNLGVFNNLAKLAELAQGEFVWMVGDDDLPRAGTVKTVVGALKCYPALDFVYINYTLWEKAKATDELIQPDLIALLPTRNPNLQSCYVSKIADLVGGDVSCFMGIFSSIWRASHAKKAFPSDLGPVWSSLDATAPHSVYIAENMLDKPAYYIGHPYLINSYDVSWGSHAVVIHLRWTPELLQKFIQCGVPRSALKEHYKTWLKSCEWGLWLVLMRANIPMRDKVSLWLLVKAYGRYAEFYGILFKLAKRALMAAGRKRLARMGISPKRVTG